MYDRDKKNPEDEPRSKALGCPAKGSKAATDPQQQILFRAGCDDSGCCGVQAVSVALTAVAEPWSTALPGTGNRPKQASAITIPKMNRRAVHPQEKSAGGGAFQSAAADGRQSTVDAEILRRAALRRSLPIIPVDDRGFCLGLSRTCGQVAADGGSRAIVAVHSVQHGLQTGLIIR